ncbi:hypothetical protein C8F01DRAFT_369096 [Mycena amicta]|nr:hypothetical protein C8F01DRAFT_369096 [Mycena amicta]
MRSTSTFYVYLRADCLRGLDEANVSGELCMRMRRWGKRVVREVVTVGGALHDGMHSPRRPGKQGRLGEGDVAVRHRGIQLHRIAFFPYEPIPASTRIYSFARISRTLLSLRACRRAHSLAEYSSLSLRPSSSVSASSSPFTLCYPRILRRRRFGGCAPCHIRERICAGSGRGADLDAFSIDFSSCRRSPPLVSGRGWPMPGMMRYWDGDYLGAGERAWRIWVDFFDGGGFLMAS